MYKKAYAVPNPVTPGHVITINPAICKGCNSCVNWCRNGILMPNAIKGSPPIILYPDECWFCGMCVEGCPNEGAIKMTHPLNQKICWKDKETGKLYRADVKDSAPPYTRPPVE